MFRRILTACVAMGLAATAALGQEPVMVTNPEWLRRPSMEQMAQYWSPAALKGGKDGAVVLDCMAAVTGHVHTCTVINERPTGLGYGASALMMSKLFQMKPAIGEDGKAVPSRVRIPINFKCAGMCGSTGVTTRRHFTNPPWLDAPTFDQWKAVCPAKALAAKTSGSVSLRCTFRAGGELRDCSVEAETPRGLGLAAAARALVPAFRGIAVDAEGRKTDGSSVALIVAWPYEAVIANAPKNAPAVYRGPSNADFDRVFPKAAAEEGLTGARTVVQCEIATEGVVRACAVASESPAGKGFGEAAVTLAQEIRFSLWSTEGSPVARRIAVPITFDRNQTPTAAKTN